MAALPESGSAELVEGGGQRLEDFWPVWRRQVDDGQVEPRLAQLCRGVRSRLGLALRPGSHVRRKQYGRRVPTDVGAVLPQDVALSNELLDRATDEVPVLRVHSGGSKRPTLAAPADTDGRVRQL